jgi:hypothetical protein
MFMTPDDLAELTDCKRMSGQIRWLSERGYRFEVSRYGRPKVLVDEVRTKMMSNNAIKSKGRTPRLDLVK